MNNVAVIRVSLLDVFGLKIQYTILSDHFVDHPDEFLVLICILEAISLLKQNSIISISIFFFFVVIDVIVLETNERFRIYIGNV
jgi:hypothetical protein